MIGVAHAGWRGLDAGVIEAHRRPRCAASGADRDRGPPRALHPRRVLRVRRRRPRPASPPASGDEVRGRTAVGRAGARPAARRSARPPARAGDRRAGGDRPASCTACHRRALVLAPGPGRGRAHGHRRSGATRPASRRSAVIDPADVADAGRRRAGPHRRRRGRARRRGAGGHQGLRARRRRGRAGAPGSPRSARTTPRSWSTRPARSAELRRPARRRAGTSSAGSSATRCGRSRRSWPCGRRVDRAELAAEIARRAPGRRRARAGQPVRRAAEGRLPARRGRRRWWPRAADLGLDVRGLMGVGPAGAARGGPAGVPPARGAGRPARPARALDRHERRPRGRGARRARPWCGSVATCSAPRPPRAATARRADLDLRADRPRSH